MTQMQTFTVKSEAEVVALTEKYGVELLLTPQQRACLQQGGSMTLSLPTTIGSQGSQGKIPVKRHHSGDRPGRSRSPVRKPTTSNNTSGVPTMFAPTPKPTGSKPIPRSRSTSPAVPTMFQTPGTASKPKPTPKPTPAPRPRTVSPNPRGHTTTTTWKKPAAEPGVPTMFSGPVQEKKPTPARRSLSPNFRKAPAVKEPIPAAFQSPSPSTKTTATPARRSLSPNFRKPTPGGGGGVPTMFSGPTPEKKWQNNTSPLRNRSRSPIIKALAQKQQDQLHSKHPGQLDPQEEAKRKAAAKKAHDKIAAAKKAADSVPTMFGGKGPGKGDNKFGKIQKVEQRAPARLNKWKEQQERRRKEAEARRKAMEGQRRRIPVVVVERVPKLSALMAMGGPEADEQKKKIALEKLAKWKKDLGEKWIVGQNTWEGISTSEVTKKEVLNDLTLEEAHQRFQNDPEKYLAMHFQPDQKEPIDFTFVLREGTIGYKPKGVRDDDEGPIILCQHIYKRLTPFPDDTLPGPFRDQYTDKMTFGGRRLHNETNNKPLLPGRGMGIGDEANMELMGDFPQPSHVRQGACVGDCWLLSAIACLADFHWAVERLFQKTIDPDIHKSPLDAANKYTVTLWDLQSWKQVDIVVDERLPVRGDGSGYLLGARPSVDGKFWVPYLEKAVAIHCGGYDKICGGGPTDAWPMLTGSRNQFVINKNPKTNKYWCGAKYNPKTGKWTDMKNSPRECPRNLWKVEWPPIGGVGGDSDEELSQDELFDMIIAWDESNYLLGAATAGTSDKHTTDGIVDNHAYSIIDSRQNVCGTGLDLLLIRNPWGEGGELENGQFMRSGAGWKQYPQIKEELNPSMEDNGLCWVTKKEFFNYFPTVYVSALDMNRLKDGNYVNDLEDHFKERPPEKPTEQPKAKTNNKSGTIHIDKESDPSSPYKIVETTFNGGLAYCELSKQQVRGVSIAQGVDEFRAHPEKYLAIHYQNNVITENWPVDKHSFTLVFRRGTEELEPNGVCKNGKKTILFNVLR